MIDEEVVIIGDPAPEPFEHLQVERETGKLLARGYFPAFDRDDPDVKLVEWPLTRADELEQVGQIFIGKNGVVTVEPPNIEEMPPIVDSTSLLVSLLEALSTKGVLAEQDIPTDVKEARDKKRAEEEIGIR